LSANTPSSRARWTERVRDAALWLRDTGLGGFGFALVLVVAVSGWAASFIGLHDFGVEHMGFGDRAAWLVPITFDGAPAGLSIVVARAATHGRSAPVWRLLIVGFTGLSSWINYQHIEDPLGREVASFMPPSAVILFEGLMSEARAAAIRRRRAMLGEVAAVRLHPARWIFAPRDTAKIVRGYVLGTALPAGFAEAAVAGERTADQAPADRTDTERTVGPDRTVSLEKTDRTADRTAGPDRTDTTDRTADHTDRTTGPDPDHQRTTDQTDRTERTADHPDHDERTADRADRTAPEADRTTGPDHKDPKPRKARTAPDQTADHTDRTTKTAATDRTTDETDRTEDLVLTDLERTAVAILQTADRSISKRSLGEVIRQDLKGSISTDRAVEIARHYRTLRAAS
jgi:hypothetical protein